MSAIVDAFSRVCDANPSRPLIHVPATGRSLTAGDVWRAHLTYRDQLCAHGVRPGTLLLIAVGNRAPLVPLVLAARAAGAAIVAVDAGTTASEMADLCAGFGAAAMVVAAGAEPGLTGSRIPLDEGIELVATGVEPASYGETALLKLTSGSTGAPKAAWTTDGQLIADSRQIIQAMAIAPGDTQLAAIPLSHAYGVSVVLVPLLLQGTPVVLRESFVPQQVPDDARRYGVRMFPGVPFMFEYFIANPPDRGWPSGLRRLVSAGARLSPETIQGFADRFGLKIHTFYGASESGGIAYDGSDAVGPADTVGHPLPGVVLTFRAGDDDPGVMRRIHVRSAGVAGGYVGEASAEFCDGGFLTGDYGGLDDAGRLMLTGRVSSFINVAGRKVQPGEVEEVLRRMPGVRDVRVLAAADPQRGEHVAACLAVEPSANGAINTFTVRRFCSARLAPHKIPRTVVVMDAIPLTARGKTDRRALEARVRAAIAGIPQQLC